MGMTSCGNKIKNDRKTILCPSLASVEIDKGEKKVHSIFFNYLYPVKSKI